MNERSISTHRIPVPALPNASRLTVVSSAVLLLISGLLMAGCSASSPAGGGSVEEKSQVTAKLGVNGADENIEDLLRIIEIEPEIVQIVAVQALGRIGTDAAVRALETLIRHESRHIREAVAQALQDVDPASYPEAGRVLVELGKLSLPKQGPSNDPNLRARRAVMTSLAVVKQPVSVDFLIDRLINDYDEHARNTSVVTLGRIDPEAVLQHPKLLEAMVNVFENDNEKNRSWAVEALGKLGDPRGIEYVRRGLVDYDKIVRGKAAMALPRLIGKDAIDELHEALGNETEDMPAVVMAGQLAFLGESDALLFLEDRVIKASDPLARAEAARILGEVGRQESMHSLNRAFSTDRDGLVIKNAGDSMRKLIAKYPLEKNEPESAE